MGTDTLADERERLVVDRWEGTTCRACDQKVQVYQYTFNLTRLLEVVRLEGWFRHHGSEYAHASDFVVQMGGNYAKLRLEGWGVIEEAPPMEATATNGRWRITARGREFLAGRLTLPQQIRVYLNQGYGPVPEAPLVSAAQVLDAASTRPDNRRAVEWAKEALASGAAFDWRLRW